MDIVTITTFAFSLLGAIALKLAIGELSDWLPSLAHKLVDRAADRLHEREREIRREEWHADLDEFPGKVTKLCRAIGFYRCALEWEQRPAKSTNPSKPNVMIIANTQHYPSSMHMKVLDRFEITVDKDALDVTVVDQTPSNGDEAREIVSFSLNKLHNAAFNTDDVERAWGQLAHEIVIYAAELAEEHSATSAGCDTRNATLGGYN